MNKGIIVASERRRKILREELQFKQIQNKNQYDNSLRKYNDYSLEYKHHKTESKNEEKSVKVEEKKVSLKSKFQNSNENI